MELIYAWVEDFRNIHQTGFSFSNRFRVTYKGKDSEKEDPNYRKLMIEKNENYFDYFKFADENSCVTNVSAVVGVNGSGKSSLLELMGSIEGNVQNMFDYFFIYHVKEELFVVECSNRGGTSHFFSNENFYGDENDKRRIIQGDTFLDCELIGGNLVKPETSLALNQLEKTALLWYKKNLEEGKNPLSGRLLRIYNPTFTSLLDELNFFVENPYIISDESKVLSIVYHMPRNFGDEHYSGHENLIENIGLRDDVYPVNCEDAKRLFIVLLLRKYVNYLFNTIRPTRELSREKSYEYREKENELVKKYIPNNDEDINELFDCASQMVKDYNLREEKNINNLRLFIRILQWLDYTFFEGSNYISIDSNKHEKECRRFLEQWKTHFGTQNELLGGAIKVDFGGNSDGEQALINIFSSISNMVQLAQNRRLQKNKNENSSTFLNHFILLLDEPDLYLHPEWNRVFIQLLEEKLTKIGNQYAKQAAGLKPSFQVIIASHSPFILSDLPSGNVIRLQKDKETGRCIVENENSDEKYLAANIHDLFNNKFFMESTIGEYVSNTLNTVMSNIIQPENKDELDAFKAKVKELQNQKNEYGRSYYEEAYLFAEQIGERIIRTKLKEMIAPYLPKDSKEKRRKELEAKHAELLKELEALL